MRIAKFAIETQIKKLVNITINYLHKYLLAVLHVNNPFSRIVVSKMTINPCNLFSAPA